MSPQPPINGFITPPDATPLKLPELPETIEETIV
jgi:hypothetical protein